MGRAGLSRASRPLPQWHAALRPALFACVLSLAAAPAHAEALEAATLQQRADESTQWMRRFELERPAIIRHVDGMPIPEGYERQTHYDWAHIGRGIAIFVPGWILTASLGLYVSDGDPIALVPCVGPILVDSDTALLAAIACVPIAIGTIEIVRAIALASPVLVRRDETAKAADRAIVSTRATKGGVRVNVALRF